MRILQIIQKPQLRGAEIFTCQVATEMIKDGHLVHIAYLFENTNVRLDFDLEFISLHANHQRRLFDLQGYAELARLIKHYEYDLVQANSGDTLKYAVLSKMLHRWSQPLVFRNANKMSDFIGGLIHRWYNTFLLSRVNYVISVSENCRLDLLTIYPSAKSISITIPQATYDVGKIRNNTKKSVNEFIIINVGSFVPEKNQRFLIDVFKAFRNKYEMGVLWLVGDGSTRKELEAYVAFLELTDFVTFFGYRRDVIKLLHEADILVMPSLIEGLPGVILEAFASGTPVIAAPVGGIPEAIETGVNGICPSAWEVIDYVDSINRILTDDAWRLTLINNARTIFLDRYNVAHVYKDFLRVYKKILNDLI